MFHTLLQLWPQAGLLLLSVVLGSLVGWERERHERPAGLRTHMLVCLGATLITLVDRSSPGTGGRIAAQIVTGVGFLGAGTIMRNGAGGVVRGLTTAASLWTVAGVGIAVGFGGRWAMLAAFCTLLVLYTLTVVSRLEDLIERRSRRQSLNLIVHDRNGDGLAVVSGLLWDLRKAGVKIKFLDVHDLASGLKVEAIVQIREAERRQGVERIIENCPEIVYHNWND